jgi:hypothetical protein
MVCHVPTRKIANVSVRSQRSECKSLKRWIPQGSKLGLKVFIFRINQLSTVVGTPSDGQNVDADQENTVIFMDDTTLSGVIDISNHSSGSPVRKQKTMIPPHCIEDQHEWSIDEVVYVIGALSGWRSKMRSIYTRNISYKESSQLQTFILVESKNDLNAFYCSVIYHCTKTFFTFFFILMMCTQISLVAELVRCKDAVKQSS